MSGVEFHYKPPPPRVKHTDEGKRRIAEAQHMRKLMRLVSLTGLDLEEISHKLSLGMGWCAAHGWRPWPRCRLCGAESRKAKKRGGKATALVEKLTASKPELAGYLKTGLQINSERQLTFSFPKETEKR